VTYLPYSPESAASPIETYNWGDNSSNTIYWEIAARVAEQRSVLLQAAGLEVKGEP